ncbi:unnamed protein product [Rotaria sordida]|uniref:Kinesin light chain n=1 Tax=Rotaria sordida TaxID=392033 RepID=A0A813RMT7_9BILA|nr:unnamed protein product [Rotaria sordida]
MNEDDIFQTAKFVSQGLDALKNEYEKILENIVHSTKILSTNKIEEKIGLIQKSMDMIDLGIDEAQVMMQIDNHLQNLESEKHKLRIQVKRLCQENAWLRDELGSTQKKLHESEQSNASYTVELENLKFLKDIKLFDNDNGNSTDQTISEINIDFNDDQIHEQDLINDLFSLDDNEQDISLDHQQNHLNKIDSDADLLILSSQSTNESFISANVYEIPNRLKTLHSLVTEYTSQGRHEVAVSLCRQALEDLEKTLGHQHPDVATMLNILALVYRDQSKFQEASSLLYDALAIREKTLGYDHPAVAATLNNLAVLYSKRNKFKEAESLCKRALEIREKCLGSSHPDVAKQLNNLAFICQNQGKYDEVESYYKHTIDIYTKNFGSNDPNVIKTKNNLASTYLKQQKYIEAEQLYKDVLTCAYEKDFQSSRKNFSSLSSTKLRNNDTQNNWYKTIEIDIPAITTTLRSLSLLYRRQGRYDTAEIIDNCASRIRKDSQAVVQALNLIQQVNHLS